MWIRLGRSGRLGLLATSITAAAVSLSACGSGADKPADLVAGKQAFVAKCGACHVLSRADSKGVAGPNLDDAFRQALADGMDETTVQGAVYEQILNPGRFDKTSKVYMPAKLVEGRDARNVAAYVAFATGEKGKDTGVLATAIKPAGAGKPAVAKAGVLALPADPGGQLAYLSTKASAPAGSLRIESKNDSAVEHNIALELDAGDEVGPVVKDAGVSTIDVSLKAGTYTYFCSVPGHREGGMQGTLTVK